VELLRFFDNASPASGRVQEPAAGTTTADGPPRETGVPALTGASPRVDAAVAALTGHLNGASKAPAAR
jgi:hypothetical protein